jgi:hypothetical protein
VVSGTNVVYTPPTGFIGGATVSYVVSDGTTSSTGMVSLTVTQSADLEMMLTGPTNGVVGLPMTFVLTVANSGPSVASNIVMQKTVSTNLLATLISNAGIRTNDVVNWPAINSLASGSATNFTITLTAENPGIYTNSASASSATFDPDPSNNGTSNGLSRVVLQIFAADYGMQEAPAAINWQTGLFEQQVIVTNTTPVAVPAFRIFVDGLRPGVTLYNASGSTNGIPYAQVNTPLNPGDFTTVMLEYYVSDRQPFTNALSVVWVLSDDVTVVPGVGAGINTQFMDERDPGSERFVIEFTTVPGEVYTVFYAESIAGPWRAAVPPVVAGSTRTQWYDDGPPKTWKHPRDTTNRFYKVIQSH